MSDLPLLVQATANGSFGVQLGSAPSLESVGGVLQFCQEKQFSLTAWPLWEPLRQGPSGRYFDAVRFFCIIVMIPLLICPGLICRFQRPPVFFHFSTV